MSNAKATPRQYSVGFVEIPDGALDVLSYYAQRPEWHVSIVVSANPLSYVARMAGILHVPVVENVSRPALVACSRLIVGSKPSFLLEKTRELVEDTRIQVLSLDQALQELGMQSEASTTTDTETPGAEFIVDDFTAKPSQPEGKPKSADTPSLTQDFSSDFDPLANILPSEPASTPEVVPQPEEAHATPEIVPQPEEAHATPEIVPQSEEAHATPEIVPQPEEAHATPEIVPQSEEAPPEEAEMVEDSKSFDAGTILGTDFRDKLGALPIDANGDQVLQEILELAVKVTHAHSGSIMLLDENRTHLRIVVADGLPSWVVAHTSQEVGKGIAGAVFATGEPRIVRGRISRRIGGSPDVRPGMREAACVAIPTKSGPIGVLNINTEAGQPSLTESTLRLLSLFAREASGAVLKAIDLKRLSGNVQKEAILRQIERLMSLEEIRPTRLVQVAEAMSQAFDASHLHYFSVSGDQLVRITPASGLAGAKSQPLDNGFLGWVLTNTNIHVMETLGETTEERMAMVYIPIHAGQPYGVILLEKLPLQDTSALELLQFLTEAKEMIEAQLALEETTNLMGDDVIDDEEFPASA